MISLGTNEKMKEEGNKVISTVSDETKGWGKRDNNRGKGKDRMK